MQNSLTHDTTKTMSANKNTGKMHALAFENAHTSYSCRSVSLTESRVHRFAHKKCAHRKHGPQIQRIDGSRSICTQLATALSSTTNVIVHISVAVRARARLCAIHSRRCIDSVCLRFVRAQTHENRKCLRWSVGPSQWIRISTAIYACIHVQTNNRINKRLRTVPKYIYYILNNIQLILRPVPCGHAGIGTRVLRVF